jgi:hypothetical protein
LSKHDRKAYFSLSFPRGGVVAASTYSFPGPDQIRLARTVLNDRRCEGAESQFCVAMIAEINDVDAVEHGLR